MAHLKYRKNNTDINVYIKESKQKIRLLQSSKTYPLSKFYSEEGKVAAITNCSYFTSSYVNGRNQGDLKNDTYSDSENGKWCDLVFFKDGTWKAGKFNSWDYKDNVVAGFSPVVMEYNNTTYYSTLIKDYNSKLTVRAPQTAICIAANNDIALIVSDGRSSSNAGLTGQELFNFIDEIFPKNQVKALLDGGGSSEMIVNGVIVNKPSDGRERKMLNALAFIEEKKQPEEVQILFPCADGWISQKFHSGHKAIDIGWLKTQSASGRTPIYACADGVVEIADYYPEVVNGVKVRPIVCIIRHDDLDPKYTYYSAYWHLSSTPKNKGDIVKMGDQIGIKGSTGFSGGVHLHFVWMKCPKGTPCPTSYKFNTYALNPLPLMFKIKGQVFDGKGQYDISLKELPEEPSKPEPPATPSEDTEALKKENSELKEQNNTLTKQNNELTEQNDSLTEQIKELNEQNNTLTQQIKELNEKLDNCTANTKAIIQKYGDVLKEISNKAKEICDLSRE